MKQVSLSEAMRLFIEARKEDDLPTLARVSEILLGYIPSLVEEVRELRTALAMVWVVLPEDAKVNLLVVKTIMERLERLDIDGPERDAQADA